MWPGLVYSILHLCALGLAQWNSTQAWVRRQKWRNGGNFNGIFSEGSASLRLYVIYSCLQDKGTEPKTAMRQQLQTLCPTHTHSECDTWCPRVLKLDFGEKTPSDTSIPELQVASLVLTLRTKSTGSLRSGSAPGVGTTLGHGWLVTSPSLGLETPLCCVLWKCDEHTGGNCQDFFFSQLDGDTVDLMYV